MEFIGPADDWEPEETSAMSLLLQKIEEEEIFDENFSTNLRRFLVKDAGIIRDKLKVVLLVESPYIHEVCYRYPLAGKTGIDVGDVLGRKAGRLLPNEPIGRSVCEDSCQVPRLGIMNVSQLPFQCKAYIRSPWWEEGAEDCQDDSENWSNYIECMKYIKVNPPGAGNYRDSRNNGGRRSKVVLNQLRDAIAKDLSRRLRCLRRRNSDVLLVRCGEIAQKFYSRAEIDMPNTCDLPHPTPHGKHKGWWRLNCEEERCLQNIVDRLWPPQVGT